MASATIRLIQDVDDKLVRFMVAKSKMELLAAANRRAYYHPLVLSAWVCISCVFIQYMKWWPKPEEYGVIGWLQPLPASVCPSNSVFLSDTQLTSFASVYVPIMFLIDWIHRPYFERLTQDALRASDMKGDVKKHYSRSPASGFWILEFGDKFVGLIAVDASTEDLDTSNTNPKATSETATIRHFYVQEPYPAAGIQTDLLSHALEHCFNSKPAAVQQIKAGESPLVPYARKALREAGFVLERNTGTVGVFRWKLGVRTLQRDAWEKKKA
ncbi:hypothetical protein B0H19DRAFT_1127508 [Mycena capillaripes]|nr:hypothetical protein B0H19DRAFT_1127508 [Mycena capillaripes]